MERFEYFREFACTLPEPVEVYSREGARTWTGYGILARNLVKISALAA